MAKILNVQVVNCSCNKSSSTNKTNSKTRNEVDNKEEEKNVRKELAENETNNEKIETSLLVETSHASSESCNSHIVINVC